MKISVRRVLSKDLVEALYNEVKESPFKVPNKNEDFLEGLIDRINKFNKKHYPFFEAILKLPSHRSNTYTVEIFTFCRDDVREVI